MSRDLTEAEQDAILNEECACGHRFGDHHVRDGNYCLVRPCPCRTFGGGECSCWCHTGTGELTRVCAHCTALTDAFMTEVARPLTEEEFATLKHAIIQRHQQGEVGPLTVRAILELEMYRCGAKS